MLIFVAMLFGQLGFLADKVNPPSVIPLLAVGVIGTIGTVFWRAAYNSKEYLALS